MFKTLMYCWPYSNTEKIFVQTCIDILANLVHTRRCTFLCLQVFCHEVVIQFASPDPSPWLYFLWVMFPQGVVNGSISENTKYRKQQRFREMGNDTVWAAGLPKAPYVLGALWVTHFLAASKHGIYRQTQKSGPLSADERKERHSARCIMDYFII